MKRLSELTLIFFVVSCITSCFPESIPKQKTKIIEVWEAQKVEISYIDYGDQYYDVYTERKDWEDAYSSNSLYTIPTPYAFALFSDGTYCTFYSPEAFDEFMEDPWPRSSRSKYKIEGNQFLSWFLYLGENSEGDYVPFFRILTNNNDTIVLEVINNGGYSHGGIPTFADEVSYNCKATFKKRKAF